MKLFLTIASLLIANLLTAPVQAQQKNFTFGIQAGVNFSKAAVHSDYVLGKTYFKTGFQAGVTADYNLNKSFALQSGLSLSTKGVKHKGGELWIGSTNAPVTYYTITVNQTYLQLPLKLACTTPVGRQTNLFVNAGPYVAYGIGGKETTKETTRPANIRGDETFAVNTFEKEQRRRGSYSLKRLDYGLTFGLGAVYKHILLSAGYELGLPDIGEPIASPGYIPPAYEYKNRTLYFTLGYRL